MKVIFFIESLRAGGKERRIVELLKGLSEKKNLKIELVLTRKEIHYKEIYDLGIPIYIAERRLFKKDPLLFFKFFFRALRSKPDIIHVWGHMVAVYAVPTKIILGIPLINNEITDTTVNAKLLGKNLVFNASDRILANTKIGLEAYGAPSKKSGVIYNGFNFNRLKNIENIDAIRRKFSITTKYVIGMVASFIEYKDWNTYVNAAITTASQRNDVTFLCIGDGDDTSFRKLVPQSLYERILFLGKQNPVEPIMSICDIGVLTTDIRFHGEGISNALLEFMALGKPVIATNYGGSVELVINGINGALVEPFNTSQLHNTWSEWLNNDIHRKQLGENALKQVKENFSIAKMVDAFYAEYVQLLDRDE